jgi:hypothetical protein
MSCNEIEESIYTYDELSAVEKTVVGTHLSTCVDCKKIWFQRQQFITATTEWRAQLPTPDHAAQLTHKIMAAVDETIQKKKTLLSWIDLINTGWVRYSLASMLLILMMVSFQQPTFSAHPTLESSIIRTPASDAILNTNSFIGASLKKIGRRPPTISVIACIQNSNCHPLVSKIKTNYENY